MHRNWVSGPLHLSQEMVHGFTCSFCQKAPDQEPHAVSQGGSWSIVDAPDKWLPMCTNLVNVL